jgi:NAD-dependent dihydropyrimidine dehydrogenase PreA subunit
MPKITLRIKEESCTGCEMCAEVCPVLAVDFDEDKNAATIADETACICCGQCMDVCPSEAIFVEGALTEKDIYMG